MASGNTIKYGTFAFTQDKIKDGTMYRSRDLLSASLEVDTLTVTVECDTPTITKFQRNAQLVRYYNGDQDGTFYVQSIKRIAPKLYTITATSKVGLLSGGQHMGGIYTGNLAGDVIKDICGDVAVAVKSNISDIKLYGWLPIATPRENLAQVLFATGATVKEDRDGTLRIEGLWDGMSSIISADRIYEDSSVDYGSDVSSVSVTEHQYTEGGELTSLFEGTAAQGDVITFSDPHYGLVATGFTIIESGANYAKVSAGSGTLQGQPYIHNTREITRTVNADAAENVKTVRNATLVSLVNSKAVAERMVNYYKCVESISAPTLYARELPGDRLGVYHPFDEAYTDACLESENVTLSGTLKAQEKSVVGFVPVAIEHTVTYEYSERIDEDGDWTVPAGVDSLRVVLIGGGDGGRRGSAGSSGSAGTQSSASGGATSTGAAGKGGKGGNAGAAGQGGKINIIDMVDLTPGEVLSFSIGAGGTGSASLSSAPGAGGATTVTRAGTTETSDDGAASDLGYTDIKTGTVYAASGTPGAAGASGGDGGTLARGAAGGAVGAYSGGSGGAVTTKAGPNIVTSYADKADGSWSTSSISVPEKNTKLSGYTDYTFDRTTGKYTATEQQTYTWGVTGYAIIFYSVTNNGMGLLATWYSYSVVQTKNHTATASGYGSGYTSTWGGGGGGGAANGTAGTDASGNAGASGATPEKPQTPTIPGTGGGGGHGGGGGGGGGSSRVVTHVNYTSTATAAAATAGSGGVGSNGGDAAPGCALLYYGIASADVSGIIKDKTGKKMIDKYNRLLIV